MLRPDYDRFMKEFNGYNPRYEFHCPENTPTWLLTFGKVIDTETVTYQRGFNQTIFTVLSSGIFVDVFVYDNAPDDDETVKKCSESVIFCVN